MRRRTCVCGAEIPWRRTLCKDCLREYGPDKAQWPEWLRFYVRDVQREINADRLHDEWELLDDFPVDDRYPSERPDLVRAAWEEIASWEDDGDGTDDRAPHINPRAQALLRYAPYADEALNRAYRRSCGIPEPKKRRRRTSRVRRPSPLPGEEPRIP